MSRGCDVIVVPYNTTAEEVLRLEPDGVMLTNGPGDPEDAKESIEMIKGIIGKVTILELYGASISFSCLWSKNI